MTSYQSSPSSSSPPSSRPSSSSYKTMNTNRYRYNIIERMGGERNFESVVLSFVDRIQADPKLEEFFSKEDSLTLAVHQEQFLTAVFTITDSLNIHNYILYRYFRLIDKGFRDRHFDILVRHFAQSLQENMEEQQQQQQQQQKKKNHHDGKNHFQEVMADAVGILRSFRYVFEKEVWRTAYEAKISKTAATEITTAATSKIPSTAPVLIPYSFY